MVLSFFPIPSVGGKQFNVSHFRIGSTVGRDQRSAPGFDEETHIGTELFGPEGGEESFEDIGFEIFRLGHKSEFSNFLT